MPFGQALTPRPWGMADQIQINVGVNSAQFQSGIAAMGQSTSRFTSDLRTKLTGAIASFGLLTGAVTLFKKAIEKAANMQVLLSSFKVLLGSGEAAKAMMKDLADLAGRTPLGLNELAESAKKLLAFGTAPGELIQTLEMLGDVAAGTGAPLNEIAAMYGKMRVQGTLYAEDLNQLLDRGVPILSLLADKYRVNEAAVKKMASEGKVSFADLEAALRKLTGAGGDWGGMMAEQAKTLPGKLAALEDAFDRLLVAFASPLLDSFGKQADKASESMERWEGRSSSFGKALNFVIQLVDLAAIGINGIAMILGNTFTGAIAVAAQGVGGLSKAMSELFTGNFSDAAATAKKTAEDLGKVFGETLQQNLAEAMKSGDEAQKAMARMNGLDPAPIKKKEAEAATKAAEPAKAQAEVSKEEAKIRERMERLQKNEADAARDRLEGEAKINALMQERARLMQEALTAPDDDKRIDAMEEEQKIRREIEKETVKQQEEAKRKAEDQRKQDEADILAIAQAREEEAKARKEAEFEQMTPIQKIAALQQEKNQLDADAARLEESDPEQAAKKRTEAIAVGGKLREEQKKLSDDETRKADDIKSKADEEAKKRQDAMTARQQAAATVPVSSLQAVGGGGRAGPSSSSDPVLRENQRQTQSLQELVVLVRQQLGVTSSPQAAPPSV